MLDGRALLGSTEPRIFTPPLRELTPQTTYGFACIAFARDVLQVELDPWQEWLLIHGLECHPDGSFRFRKIVVLVARQNGKSMLSQVLSLFFLYVLGLPLILGTAQDLDTATSVWQGAVDLVMELDEDDQPVRADLHAMVDRVIMINGQKSLKLLPKSKGGTGRGGQYKVKAANRRAGRGLTGDLIVLDELREHQSWDAWAAITGTTSARPNAQIWALSNAGDATSVVLRFLRKKAHAALGDPDGINAAEDPAALLTQANEAVDLDGEPLKVEDIPDDTLGLFEWSARPGRTVMDRDGWCEANPSLGRGRVTERSLYSAAQEPEWVFRTEYLCQWTDGTLEGPFPAGKWDECRDPDSRLAPAAAMVLCLDVAWDRSAATITMAGPREDGLLHVEVLASSAGTEWAIPWLSSPDRHPLIRSKTVGIVVQASGAPAASMIEALEAAGFRIIEWKGTDVPAASGDFYDKVRSTTVRHRGQPILDVAAAVAVAKPSGDGFMWNRRASPVDISPLVGVTGAAWYASAEVAAAYDVLDSVL